MTLFSIAKASAYFLHGIVSRAPQPFSQAYSRCFPPLAARTQNFVCEHAWPPLVFPARSVAVARGIDILLTPHIGEFDQAALFKRRLDYEADVFAWLSENAPTGYDIVIEIGECSCLHSIFRIVDQQISRSQTQEDHRIRTREEPYRRLLGNLQVNASEHLAPIHDGRGSGFPGYDRSSGPEGHLTNGSFVREFAALFSEQVSGALVPVVAASELEHCSKMPVKSTPKGMSRVSVPA